VRVMSTWGTSAGPARGVMDEQQKEQAVAWSSAGKGACTAQDTLN